MTPAVERLIGAIQDLSTARDVERVREIVRTVARRLGDADGATFVLREGDQCRYVDEDAIGPLWKGLTFPMSACVSGWAMINRRAAIVPDIFEDSRIPLDAYRPTFVRSLVMVPIRDSDPLGAIGVYWSRTHEADAHLVELLQALANTTAVALENVRVYAELEERVRIRTEALQAANAELDAFAHSVSHDLRGPLRHISNFTRLMQEHAGAALDQQSRHYANRVVAASEKMTRLIDDLLRFARSSRATLNKRPVDLREAFARARDESMADAGGRHIEWRMFDDPVMVDADPALLHQAILNLLTNAVKYSRGQPVAIIEVAVRAEPAEHVVSVRDNGAGFDPSQAERLFGVFQRLHSPEEFEGTGVGLANVRRIVHRHGGRTWAEGAVDKGATFWFSLPRSA